MMMSPRFWTIALGLAIGLTSPAAAQTLKGKAAQALPLAEAGDVVSQLALGVYYDVGAEGAPKDYAEALKWYRAAAEQGSPQAQGKLGRMYADGRGAPQNHAEAYVWLSVAAKTWPDPVAAIALRRERDEAAGKLSPAELAAVSVGNAVALGF